jgi:DNA-binding Lrp family transcriptional regulator
LIVLQVVAIEYIMEKVAIIYVGIPTLRYLARRNVGITKARILRSIVHALPEGRFVIQIAEELGLHRETVAIHLRSLEKEGLVVREGVRGKYYLAEKAAGDNGLRAYMFSQFALRNVTPDSHVIDADRINSIYKGEDSDPKEILDYANKVGAFVTYMLIEGIRLGLQSEIGEAALPELLRPKKIKHHLFPEIWAEATIRPRNLLWYFRELGCVAQSVEYPSRSTSQARVEALLHYRMDKSDIDRLRKAFRIAYPRIAENMERFSKEMPDRIKEYQKLASVTEDEVRDRVKDYMGRRP